MFPPPVYKKWLSAPLTKHIHANYAILLCLDPALHPSMLHLESRMRFPRMIARRRGTLPGCSKAPPPSWHTLPPRRTALMKRFLSVMPRQRVEEDPLNSIAPWVTETIHSRENNVKVTSISGDPQPCN